jgi:hypothetical protein
MALPTDKNILARSRGLVVLLVFVHVLSGCSLTPTPASKLKFANELAAAAGWVPLYLQSNQMLDVQAYLPKLVVSGTTLRVFIEGDGDAWLTKHKPSTDPTPKTPVALKMALNDTHESRVYLARPCQFESRSDPMCRQSYWTAGRYSMTAVKAMSAAIDQVKQSFDAQRIELVGYSGGATIALLLAARRDDVARVLTVAGNLSVKAWTDHHDVTPLYLSLDPVNFVDALRDIPQIHYVGSEDDIVPPSLTQEFQRLFKADAPIEVKVQRGFTHFCCWGEFSLDK